MKKSALAIIDVADSKGYTKITGKTQEERKQNILNFFENSLEESKATTYEEKPKFIPIKKVAHF